MLGGLMATRRFRELRPEVDAGDDVEYGLLGGVGLVMLSHAAQARGRGD
ncbi:MAG: hypothetical protein ACOCTG_01595 [Bacteroidota bacterium]